jgi:hypothetical protein
MRQLALLGGQRPRDPVGDAMPAQQLGDGDRLRRGDAQAARDGEEVLRRERARRDLLGRARGIVSRVHAVVRRAAERRQVVRTHDGELAGVPVPDDPEHPAQRPAPGHGQQRIGVRYLGAGPLLGASRRLE